MRKSLIILFAFATLGISLNGVRAEIIKLGKHDVAEVRKACGSSFEPASDGSGYGCTKPCKSSSGKSGQCTVACDNNNNCTGSTPDIKVQGGRPFAGSLNAVLTNRMRMQTGGSVNAGNKCDPPLIKCASGECARWCSDGVSKPPSAGILDSGPGFGASGPAATGAPRAPAAPAAGRIN